MKVNPTKARKSLPRQGKVLFFYLVFAVVLTLLSELLPKSFSLAEVYILIIGSLAAVLVLRFGASSSIPLINLRKTNSNYYGSLIVNRKGVRRRYRYYDEVKSGSSIWRILEKLQREGGCDLVSSSENVVYPAYRGAPPRYLRATRGSRFIFFAEEGPARKTAVQLESLIRNYLSSREFNQK